MKAVVEGNTSFALDLYGRLRKEEGNLFLSPYSISTALAMTYAGARGETEKQMAKVLRLPLEQKQLHLAFSELQNKLNEDGKKGAYELSVANALWGQKGYPFLKDFLAMIKNSYGGGLNEVDFIKATESARTTINTWIEKKTNNKIKEIIAPGVLNDLTRLVLTNAIYFKGKWATQFEKKNTKEAPFILADGKKVNIPMMYQKSDFRYMEKEGCQILELPYKGDALSMLLLLPGKTDGLPALESRLVRDGPGGWLASMQGKREVVVYLPKFTMTKEFMLADVLRAMGMTDAFSLPPADFSGMTGKKDLFISAVIHKAFVDVNEEGTEAAAATAVVMRASSVQMTVFRADHPFLFLIRDNRSGSILFIGRVVNPTL
ncbi:MAG: serpin family protein [Candidatus Aureabacteria bacterium]|nr:serpin family protein [Candidatus Auribacterota bacterium]